MSDIIQNQEYKQWFKELKDNIRQRQIKASISVNTELILMYWDLGRQIFEKQEYAKWGSGFIDQLSKDLKIEFPDMSGFSRDNLYYMKRFYLSYNQDDIFVEQVVPQIGFEIVEQAVPQLKKQSLIEFISQIPWGHNVVILKKVKNLEEAKFYIFKTIENSWSRSVLEYQIETGLFKRQGKAITNFDLTLPKPGSDLAIALLKDPYNFDFITLAENAKEKELEDKLVHNITRLLLELGKGFAYMGRQFELKVGKKEYRTDLLFYHTKLKCYIVIELKLKDFEPEFLGKLNFYLTAVNEFVKEPEDKPTIGILLCKSKDNYDVEFALKDINKPIGVSEFKYMELPEEIRNALPSSEELKNELNRIEDEQ
ncbi:MAG: PDDEXK nuclease domain-containing protein [bacterium]